MKRINFLAMVMPLSYLVLPFAQADDAKPIAIVWGGNGPCAMCATSASYMAELAGFQAITITLATQDQSIFDHAKVFIQPGGFAVDSLVAMGPSLVNRVKKFVNDGGGFVGFCAGAFTSTTEVGTSGEAGYGFVPGGTHYHAKEPSEIHQILTVKSANGSERSVYFAGGPEFTASDAELARVQGQVTYRYADGTIAGIQAHYGNGLASVVGFHPEANFIWKKFALWRAGKPTVDPDGDDFEIAVAMIRAVSSQN